MLHYVYWGTTMPPAAQKTLDRIVKEVYQDFLRATEANEALNMDWVFVEKSSVKAVLEKLKWWMGEGKTVSTQGRVRVTELLTIVFSRCLPLKVSFRPSNKSDPNLASS